MRIYYCEMGSRNTTLNMKVGDLKDIYARIKEMEPDTFAFQEFQKKVRLAVKHWEGQPVNPQQWGAGVQLNGDGVARMMDNPAMIMGVDEENMEFDPDPDPEDR